MNITITTDGAWVISVGMICLTALTIFILTHILEGK